MSTALALKTPDDPASALDKLFDFQASHERATARLKRALDGNGAVADDLASTKRWERREGAIVTLNVRNTWTSNRRTYTGRVTGNVEYVSEGDLEGAYRRYFDAYAEQSKHVDSIVSTLTSSPKEGFAADEKVDLGAIPLAFASQSHCGACDGYGQVKCTGCFGGRNTCPTCFGKKWIWAGNSQIACPAHCMYGQVYCSACHGSMRLGCGPCDRTGLFTTVWTGKVHAEITCEIGTPEGCDAAWTKSLVKSGHAWLADAGFVEKPRIVKGQAGALISWLVRIPVMGQTIRIGEKAFDVRYVGRNERMWSVPRFLDDLLKPLAARISAAQPAEAFRLAGEAPVFAEVGRGVLQSPRSDESVARTFENAVSPDILAGVRGRLESNRDGIARSTVATVWKYAATAIALGALIALASGRTRSALSVLEPALLKPGNEVAVAIAGGVVMAILLAATYPIAGIAGRSAVRSVLGTRADRLPEQGRAPAFACIAALLVYSAGAYALTPKASSATVRPVAASTARPSPVAILPDMPVVRPPTIPPFYR